MGEAVTDQRSSWVRRLSLSRNTVYVKTYEYASWRDRLRSLWRWTAPWRRSRAARECDAYAWLAEHGFPAPAAFACFERRSAGLLARATLVTAAVPGEPADQLLAMVDEAQRQALGRRIGAFVHRLHALGFRDRNLDLRNLLVDGDQIAKIDSPRHVLVRPGAREDRLSRADWARLLPQLAKFGLEQAARDARS
jgi:hypothetical protein